jgi:hypothetical protein
MNSAHRGFVGGWALGVAGLLAGAIGAGVLWVAFGVGVRLNGW